MDLSSNAANIAEGRFRAANGLRQVSWGERSFARDELIPAGGGDTTDLRARFYRGAK